MKPEIANRLHGLQLENDGHRAIMDSMRPRFDRMAARHENGTAPRAVSAYQLFQTPAPLARRLVEAVGIMPGMRVLEPSAGLGRLLDAIPRCEVVAVELAAACASELFRQNREGVTLTQRDFLACHLGELGTFDRVVMNPPFHMRADIRHIRHALTFLKPGGRLAALCLDTRHRSEALRPSAATWEPVPAGTFGKEGTSVPTILATFTR